MLFASTLKFPEHRNQSHYCFFLFCMKMKESGDKPAADNEHENVHDGAMHVTCGEHQVGVKYEAEV